MKFTIFYAWQKQSPNSTNRAFIEKELEAAAKEFQSDDVVVVIDRDTAGVPGAPDIGQTILEKIGVCDLLVGDLSIVNPNAPAIEERQTPNGNVLVEVGYALGTIGPKRVLLVMNEAYGKPEALPFDLRQKRAGTYELREGEDKTAARKQLRAQLRTAIKGMVDAGPRAAPTAPPRPDPTKEAIDAIAARMPNQAAAAKRFVRALTEDLIRIDSEAKAETREDRLLLAIEATRPMVNNFGTLAQAIAEWDSKDALHGLVQGFEHLLTRYEFHGSGSFDTRDFDLYKFVGHELMVILAAHLIRAERWPLFPALFAETIQYEGRRDYPVGVNRVCDNVLTLEKLSESRKRASIHADLLKDRHDLSPPLADVPFGEFMGGDLMLYLGSRPWFPWSGIYIAHQVPRFLTATTTIQGSRALATALGIPNLEEMKANVTQLIKGLQSNLGRMGAWWSWDFDPAKIATQ